MAVTVKKYKLFKVCKELNVGMDTVRPFLEKKGLKISGPNTPIPEDVYQDILQNFSREKEMADQLYQRKSHSDDDEMEMDERAGMQEPPEKSIYVQAIERSIEERMEEMIREEEEQPEPPKKTTKKKAVKQAEGEEEKLSLVYSKIFIIKFFINNNFWILITKNNF